MSLVEWILSLVAINAAGLILITIYSTYYSFGTMIFGTDSLAVITTIARHFRK